MTNTELFLELARPDKNGCSRWVYRSEWVGKYDALALGNGLSWGRKSSPLAKKYIIETCKSDTPGNRVDRVRLIGFNIGETFSQAIRPDIKKCILSQKCVMLGVRGKSENTKIEVDHKDGRKNDLRISNMKSQKLSDFQPLCKAANDIKRQICKRCKETDKRWDATNIAGNPYPFYEGDEDYNPKLGCKGCYQYDPVEYRKTTVKKISKEASKHTVDYIMGKLYPNDNTEK